MASEEIVTIEDTKGRALAVVTENELSSDESIILKNALLPFFDQAEEWVRKAKTLTVTDENQIEKMVEARTARLALKDIRVNLDKKRKELKEESLRKGKAIDGMANILKFLIEPIEEYLEKQEKFVEIREAERKEKLQWERKEKLSALGVDTSFYDLKEMTEAVFQDLLATSTENKRLRDEATEREEKERKDKEKAEREAKAEQKRLAKMGDAEKIAGIVETLQAIKLPEVKSEEAQALVARIQKAVDTMIEEVKKF